MPQNNQVRFPTIKVGADPELFLKDKKTGKYVSAHDLLPGTKAKPFKVEYGAIQVDGTAAEFNIEPAVDGAHFVHYNKNVLKQLQDRLPNHTLVIEPSVTFDPDYFKTLPLSARDLGCNPDFNGWTKQQNDSPDPSKNPSMRTASGHIHIGWNEGNKDFNVNDPGHFDDCCVVARQMDYFLGIWSLAWDPDPTRRTLYGKAGAFRPKPYGIEYRTLSNKWLGTNELMGYVWQQAFNGLKQLFMGNNYEDKFGDSAKRIIDENITDWYHRKEFSKIVQSLNMPPVKLPPAKDGLLSEEKKINSKHYKTVNKQRVVGPAVNVEEVRTVGTINWDDFVNPGRIEVDRAVNE